ncbi:porin family protein [Paracoccus sp. MC1854]|nr:porin family protein [Paracoccus sp. MC1854]
MPVVSHRWSGPCQEPNPYEVRFTLRINLVVASAAVLFSVPSAYAGGYIAPVVDVEPAPVIVAPAASDWQGGYAGITLGYAFGGDDRVGAYTADDRFIANLGDAEISGANGGLHVGYRWQRNRWVIGPELSYTFSNISDDFGYDVPGLGSGTFKSEVDDLWALKLKTGYLARPDTLVYGIAGYQEGNFTLSAGGSDVEYDADGYVVGLGVERLINDRLSVTGEWEYSDFGTTDVEILGANTSASSSFHNVKVGLNFRF